MIALEVHANGVIVPVNAQPGARRNGLAGAHAGALKVQVTQAPEDGKATEAVLGLLAKALQVRRSQTTLLSGASSRQKRILVAGLSIAEVASRLRAPLEDA